MLKGLVLTNPGCSYTDFRTAPWNTMCLVTPRHSVRTQWNKAMVCQHCKDTGHTLFICPAYDTINNRQLTLSEQYCMQYCSIQTRSKGTWKEEQSAWQHRNSYQNEGNGDNKCEHRPQCSQQILVRSSGYKARSSGRHITGKLYHETEVSSHLHIGENGMHQGQTFGRIGWRCYSS